MVLSGIIPRLSGLISAFNLKHLSCISSVSSDDVVMSSISHSGINESNKLQV